MNFIDALQASASGLSTQRYRMNLISSNLANLHTTRTPEGGPYRRKEMVIAARPQGDAFEQILQRESARHLTDVEIVSVVNDTRPPRLKYNPHHPDADEKGFVAMPNINLVEEMANLMSAARSYEANVTAANATKKMALKALQIGE